MEDKLGSAYEPYIFGALNSASVMVVIGTKKDHFEAVWVKNEWSRFLSMIKVGKKKVLIPAYRDMDPYDLPKEFSHLQAQDMAKLGFMQDLVRGIKKIIGRDKKGSSSSTERATPHGGEYTQNSSPLLRRAFLFLEDGEFDNADEYAEKVLDINPECAEAYVVKLLVELKLNKPSDLAEASTPIHNSHNYQKAVRFASSEYKEVIKGYNNAILERIDLARKSEVYSRGVDLMLEYKFDEAISHFEKIESYKDSAKKLEDCKKLKEEARCKEIYKRAIDLLNVKQYDTAAKLFSSIEAYLDAKEKVNLCAERKENARRDAIYYRALNRVSSHYAPDTDIKKSIEELLTISGYRDVDEKVGALNARLEKLYEDRRKAQEAAKIKAEEERRNRERLAELHRIRVKKAKKAAKKGAIIGIPSIASITVFLVLLFTLIIPLIRFNTADGLLNEGKFEEAMAIYNDIAGFQNSRQRIELLNGIKLVEEANYEDGVEAILAANVPVKIHYTMAGGDFSGNAYASAPIEYTDGTIIVNTYLSSYVPEAKSGAAVNVLSYNKPEDFPGIMTPGREGYRFMKWVLTDSKCSLKDGFELHLEASWSAKDYEIYYNLSGGETDNPLTYSIEDSAITLHAPLKKGYTFLGWSEGDGTDISKSITIPAGSVGPRRFTAHWSANSYTISFDANGGTVSIDTKDVVFDSNVTLPIPTREGYTFNGWYYGNKACPDGVWKEDSDLTLEAKWTGKSYLVTYKDTTAVKGTDVKITFDYNYTGADSSSIILSNGQILNYPSVPAREGFAFTGWYTDPECTTIYEFKGTISYDMTLYAGWDESLYYETFNDPTSPWIYSDGVLVSSNKDNNTSSTYKIIVKDDVTVSFSYRTSSELNYDYLFIKKNGNILISSSGIKSYTEYSIPLERGDVLEFTYSKNISGFDGVDCAYIKDLGLGYYSRYTSSATVSCNKIIEFKYEAGKNSSETVVFGENHKLPSFSRDGYVFGGWYYGNKKIEDGEWSIPSNVTLVPKWNSFTYTNTTDGIIITGSKEVDSDLIIPEEINGKKVLAIGHRAFSDCNNIKSLTIPDSVKTIGSYAFDNCYNIETVSFGSNVTSIGECAFNRCSKLSNIVIPSKVTTIEVGAFAGCKNLISVTIPSSVTTILIEAFAGCSKLTSISVDKNNTTYKSIDGNLYSKDGKHLIQYAIGKAEASFSIPDGVEFIDYMAFSGCTNLKNVVISDSVKVISIHAFSGCSSLTGVTIEKGVISIGNYAFSECDNLTDITIPDSVTDIGTTAFRECSSLVSAKIGSGVTKIGAGAFSGCSKLESLTIPFVGSSKTTTSASSATLFGYIFGTTSYTGGVATKQYYSSSSYTTYYIPSSLKNVTVTGGNLLYGAFYNCSGITNITIGNNVSGVGTYAFKACTSLTGITVPDSVKSIDSYAFSGCSMLESAKIGSGVTSIGSHAFQDCHILESIVIPNSTKSIGTYTFLGCSNLSSAEIGSGVTSIGAGAFSGCSKLESLTIPFVGSSKTATSASNFTLFGYIFGTTSYTGGVATKQYYSSSSYTTYYIPSSLKNVTVTGGNLLYGAFYNCSGITNITIGNNVSGVGTYAFKACTSLTGITVPDSVKSIDSYAFSGCSMLESAKIGSGVTSIGAGAFSGCSKLESLTIPFVGSSKTASASSSTLFGYIFGTTSYTGGVATMQYYNSAGYCTTYHIPSSLKSIKITGGNILYGAFYNCNGLIDITIPDSVTSIGEYAFYNCSKLTSITMPDSVTSIGVGAFEHCTSLTSATIPDSVTSIGSGAFSDCSSLTEITIPNSVTSIGTHAFLDCDSLIIYCEAASKPNGWDPSWNSDRPVVWDCYYTSMYSYKIENGKAILTEYNGTDTNVTIPSAIGGYEVIDFGNIFAENSSITSVTIPDSITSIGAGAFYDCWGLTSVTIGNKVASIGGEAFAFCYCLTSITIPDNVTNIGARAFCCCEDLTDINVAEDNAYYKSIDGNLYSKDGKTLIQYAIGKNATYFIIPDSVTSIGSSAFENCGHLASVVIPNSVTSIGDYAFYSCYSLTSINYRGTSSQWQAITKGTYWNVGTGSYTITYNYKN